VPGSHESIFVEPNVGTLAKELQHALSLARSADASSARTSAAHTLAQSGSVDASSSRATPQETL
jgi:hypothetical protein